MCCPYVGASDASSFSVAETHVQADNVQVRQDYSCRTGHVSNQGLPAMLNPL